MLWHSPKRKKEDDDRPSDLTIGQRFDFFELAGDLIFKAAGGSPLNIMTMIGASADVSISTATAKRGNAAGAGLSAVGAQASGIAGFYAGDVVGAMIGTFILPGVGTAVGGFIGGAIGTLTGDKVGRRTTQHLFNSIVATRPRVNFGTFKDSQPAYTMRQRAEQELSGSLLNARRYLGREAQLMHQ